MVWPIRYQKTALLTKRANIEWDTVVLFQGAHNVIWLSRNWMSSLPRLYLVLMVACPCPNDKPSFRMCKLKLSNKNTLILSPISYRPRWNKKPSHYVSDTYPQRTNDLRPQYTHITGDFIPNSIGSFIDCILNPKNTCFAHFVFPFHTASQTAIQDKSSQLTVVRPPWCFATSTDHHGGYRANIGINTGRAKIS